LAGASAGLLGLTSMVYAGFAFGGDTALVLGPGGFSTPPPRYVEAVEQLYLEPNGYGDYTTQPLTTPEAVFPAAATPMFTDPQTNQAITLLDNAIMQDTVDGGHVVVFGYSGSATIAFLEQEALNMNDNAPDPSQLAFVLAGDPSNPNGGLYDRVLPSYFSADHYPTDVYTQEYDGFADFPQYPLNTLSDLNAIMGMIYQHSTYANLTPEQISSAIPLPTTGDSLTHYYMIPTENLPLLEPLRLLPGGNQLADLLQPDLKVLVNLGYGSITDGWSQGPANAPTPFGIFPNVNPAEVATALMNGAQQGMTDAMNDTPSLTGAFSPTLIDELAYTYGLTETPDPSLPELLSAIQSYINGGALTASSVEPTASPATAAEDLVNTATTDVAHLIGQPGVAVDGLSPFLG
jgi:hypothetical protein